MSPRAWLPFLFMTLVMGLLLNWPIWMTVAASLLVVMLIASYWQRHALDNIRYHRRWHYTRAFPGERSMVKIEVENHKLLPVSWLRIMDPWPKAVAPEDETDLGASHLRNQVLLTNLYSLRWYERSQRSYELLFRQRGVYPVGPLRLVSGDLFGMYEDIQDVENTEYLTVFPEILPLAALKLRAEDPFGDRRARRRLFEDPNQVIGVRDYHPEDGFRKVHWPATARTGTLQARVYQAVSSQMMVVCLNVATTPRFWDGVIAETLEQLIKVSATLAYQGMQSGYAVGLISNGYLAHAGQPFRIPPGRTPEQLARLLQTLAALTPLTTTSFEQYLMKASSSLPYGATLVIVTALITPGLSETLLRLARYRKHMTLISLEVTTPPAIRGIRTIHLPYIVKY
jgi:uncharacterized protein (DUF58 family)